MVTEKMEAEQLGTSEGTPVAAECRPTHASTRSGGLVCSAATTPSKTRSVGVVRSPGVGRPQTCVGVLWLCLSC